MQDTLAAYKNRPLTRHIDLTEVNVPELVKQYPKMREFLQKTEGAIEARPEVDAISFYMLNHAMGVIEQRFAREEPLGAVEELVAEYYDAMNVKALRAFFYLLLICTRESRHVYDNATLFKKLDEKYGCMSFTHTIKGGGSSGAVEKLLKHPPNNTLGNYTNHLVDIFFDGQYSGGYGGKKWGEVAKVLRDYVHGTITGEMMMDVVWTLCHNGGPIFNKGMLYEHYDAAQLKMILDVQRSGQIPQMVANSESKYVNSTHKRLLKKCAQHLGAEEFSGYVDWFVVEALGSIGKYPEKKSSQTKQHGKSKKADQADKLAEVQKKIKEAEEKKKAEEFKKTHFEVMPGVSVKKYIRNSEAA